MLTIGYLSKFPAAYRNRESSVKFVTFNEIKADKISDEIINIKSKTDKYIQEVEIYDKTIHLNSKCKIFCSCESFKFEFANSLFRQESLLHPTEFIRSVISRPKKTNQFNIVSPCKHIIALLRTITRMKIPV